VLFGNYVIHGEPEAIGFLRQETVLARVPRTLTHAAFEFSGYGRLSALRLENCLHVGGPDKFFELIPFSGGQCAVAGLGLQPTHAQMVSLGEIEAKNGPSRLGRETAIDKLDHDYRRIVFAPTFFKRQRSRMASCVPAAFNGMDASPFKPQQELSAFHSDAKTISETSVIRAFREWVRQHAAHWQSSPPVPRQ
jgi:hypothetical protein